MRKWPLRATEGSGSRRGEDASRTWGDRYRIFRDGKESGTSLRDTKVASE